MNKETITKVLESLSKEIGDYPYNFFNILHRSSNPNIDLEKQNISWEFIKTEKWHSLDLNNYLLWSISDNGDLLWWNGEQIIAMNPRASEYISVPVEPKQFIRLVGMGKIVGIFPPDLWKKNS